MEHEVKLSDLRRELETLSYPVTQEEVVAAFDDVVLLYADGEEPLADVLGRANDDTFDDAEDLQTVVYNHLPTEAVGEPGQSEGEG
ncbi:DUF5789 family protein [Halobacterium zhouii]|uniref:DUF5789 family protein n=1 Tax=Halobacterium zhouii TaxID=2902624 RepID=UPI001E2A38C8|nr:hypothetical protein [Halobacterium zhouii]